jgi:hypothetical protein
MFGYFPPNFDVHNLFLLLGEKVRMRAGFKNELHFKSRSGSEK